MFLCFQDVVVTLSKPLRLEDGRSIETLSDAHDPVASEATAALISKYPDRFLFGSDVVAPKSIDSPMQVYNLYEPLWRKLSPEVSQKVRLGNYQRLFDAARLSVRAQCNSTWNVPSLPCAPNRPCRDRLRSCATPRSAKVLIPPLLRQFDAAWTFALSPSDVQKASDLGH